MKQAAMLKRFDKEVNELIDEFCQVCEMTISNFVIGLEAEDPTKLSHIPNTQKLFNNKYIVLSQ